MGGGCQTNSGNYFLTLRVPLDLEAESVLNEVSSAYGEVARAEEAAQVAFDMASQAKNRYIILVMKNRYISQVIKSFQK